MPRRHDKKSIQQPATALVLLCASSLALADLNHYENVLVGDRAAGMAGAYTAVSDDASGLYHNPAGIVYTSGTGSISGSMNAFNYTRIQYDRVLGDTSWKRTSSNLYPNYFGIVQPLKSGSLGFSFAVTDTIEENQDQSYFNFTPSGGIAISRYTINYNNEDNTINLGPSYAFKWRENFSMGLTLYFHHRRQEAAFNQQVYFQNGDNRWRNDYFQTEEFGIRPILGVMWTPLDKLSIGVNFNQTLLLSADSQRQSTLKDIGDVNVPPPLIETSGDKRETPFNLDVGLGYFPSEKLLFAADFGYYSPRAPGGAVVNAAAGMEVYLNPRWALRAGIYTNMANTPAVQANRTNQLEYLNIFGISASISRFAKKASITLGMSAGFGSGDAQVIDGSTEIQPVSYRSVTLFMSGVYTY